VIQDVTQNVPLASDRFPGAPGNSGSEGMNSDTTADCVEWDRVQSTIPVPEVGMSQPFHYQ
jgi:hypothetical protein